MKKVLAALKKLFTDARTAYQQEPVRVNAYLVTLLTAAGVPVAVAGVPLATVVAIVLGGVVFTEGTRASVFSPTSVQEIAAEAAAAAKPKPRRKKKA